uniref:(California timema) hypothetical protein n=1 Tax=Timema californicum TaxID=61474 RepID=A0A7R9P8K8_TIMCA|nr:unnamed protein product [Timema californicum]
MHQITLHNIYKEVTLRTKIQALKKTINKADKKRKKEIAEEVTKLESELESRQNAELSQLKESNSQVDNTAVELDKLSTNENSVEKEEKTFPKVSKAQKRREKKSTKEKEREEFIKEQEEKNKTGARNVETKKIKQILKKRNLMIHKMPSDGNCLYSAVDHQRKMVGEVGLGLSRLRLLTADYLRQNRDEFLPFISHPETGNMLTEEQYYEYCDQVAGTPAWGGEVEVTLSQALRCAIEVVQAEGPSLILGEEYDSDKRLVLAYHRYMFGLGEHYNSVKRYEESPEEEDDLPTVETA